MSHNCWQELRTQRGSELELTVQLGNRNALKKGKERDAKERADALVRRTEIS